LWAVGCGCVVVEVGDSVGDVEEGLHAGCGLVAGVTSGADAEEALLEAGADLVMKALTHLRLA
jgi:phosphoglycolate phosphatase-like HAD superfamily hydrolase